MKKLLLVSILISLLFQQRINSQITFEKYFGGPDFDRGNSVQQTTDGGYIICGDSYINNADYIYLVKTNEYGDTTWTKRYGIIYWDDLWYNTCQSFDEGYMIVGTTCNQQLDSLKIHVIKTDSQGNMIWEKKYDNNGIVATGDSFQSTKDSCFIIVGSTRDSITDISKIYILKIDSTGNKIWDISISGINHTGGGYIQELEDGYIVTGITDIFNIPKFILIRLDNNNNTVWSKTYNGACLINQKMSVKQTNDEGFILFATKCIVNEDNYAGYILKTNADGDSLWTKVYPGIYGSFFFQGYPVSNGGYVALGSIFEDDIDYYLNLYVIKTDEYGNIEWERIYGGSTEDSGFDLNLTNDGGYIITGATESFGAGSADIYLIKTDADGNVSNIFDNQFLNKNDITIYPNPFSTFTTIQLPFQEYKNAEVIITIHDILGRQVNKIETKAKQEIKICRDNI